MSLVTFLTSPRVTGGLPPSSLGIPPQVASTCRSPTFLSVYIPLAHHRSPSMASLANGSIPTVKVESSHDDEIKDEPMEDTVPYMDDQDDDGGDIDFAGAKREIWLGHVPRALWNILSQIGTKDDDEEIEIGTIRAEGPESRPQRVSDPLSAAGIALTIHYRSA